MHVTHERAGCHDVIDYRACMAQTKGLLFDKIDRRLRGLYKQNMPVLYSVPIVNMDWEQADLLKAQTAKI